MNPALLAQLLPVAARLLRSPEAASLLGDRAAPVGALVDRAAEDAPVSAVLGAVQLLAERAPADPGLQGQYLEGVLGLLRGTMKLLAAMREKEGVP